MMRKFPYTQVPVFGLAMVSYSGDRFSGIITFTNGILVRVQGAVRNPSEKWICRITPVWSIPL